MRGKVYVIVVSGLYGDSAYVDTVWTSSRNAETRMAVLRGRQIDPRLDIPHESIFTLNVLPEDDDAEK
jgi:hypothetical protein